MEQSERPVSGHIYSIMKKCRSYYHYLLRPLIKKKKRKNKDCNFKKGIKSDNYWKTMKVVRKNNFNTANFVDRHIGGKHILLTILSKI